MPQRTHTNTSININRHMFLQLHVNRYTWAGSMQERNYFVFIQNVFVYFQKIQHMYIYMSMYVCQRPSFKCAARCCRSNSLRRHNSLWHHKCRTLAKKPLANPPSWQPKQSDMFWSMPGFLRRQVCVCPSAWLTHAHAYRCGTNSYRKTSMALLLSTWMMLLLLHVVLNVGKSCC